MTGSPFDGAKQPEADEIQISVPWGHVSGKWWGPKDEQPVILLHGWQDNAGSFDNTVPLLSKDIDLPAIDLVGKWWGPRDEQPVILLHGWQDNAGSFDNTVPLLSKDIDLPAIDLVGKWWGPRDEQPVILLHGWQDNAGSFDNTVPLLSKDIDLPAIDLVGKWWGPKDEQPVILLHGWQDNAGSFDNIVPLLSKDIALLAIDLVGHGRSSHQPAGIFPYVVWDGVCLLRRVVEHYQWRRIKILGHSLGGAIGFMYAATFPDEVDSLMCLDIVSPTIQDLDETVNKAPDYVDKFITYDTSTSSYVPCYDHKEMIDLLIDAYRGSVTRDSAEVLMRRGAMPAPTPGRYYFSLDPRVKLCLVTLLSMDMVMAYASRVRCAYLNIRAIPGRKYVHPEYYENVVKEIKRHARKFEYHEVRGTHHVHLNEPEKVAPIINAFLESL